MTTTRVETPRVSVVAVADRYLQSGLVAHDPSRVPLAPDCVRFENGHNSGASGEGIAKGLKNESMRSITGIRNLKWVVEGDAAVAIYELDTVRGVVFITEYFRVVDGMIKEILATFTSQRLE